MSKKNKINSHVPKNQAEKEFYGDFLRRVSKTEKTVDDNVNLAKTSSSVVEEEDNKEKNRTVKKRSKIKKAGDFFKERVAGIILISAIGGIVFVPIGLLYSDMRNDIQTNTDDIKGLLKTDIGYQKEISGLDKKIDILKTALTKDIEYIKESIKKLGK